jgi:hypothetical protein
MGQFEHVKQYNIMQKAGPVHLTRDLTSPTNHTVGFKARDNGTKPGAGARSVWSHNI